MRPKALKANTTLIPLEAAELLAPEEPLEPGELVVEVGVLEVEPGLEPVEEGLEEVNVTPTARHASTAAAMDWSRSVPEQLFWKQRVSASTNAWLLHKQAVSARLHEPGTTEVKQGRAQLA